MVAQGLYVLHLDKLKHFQYGGVKQIIPVIVRDQGFNNRSKQVPLNTNTINSNPINFFSTIGGGGLRSGDDDKNQL